jgi:UDP-glucose 4-epimerase
MTSVLVTGGAGFIGHHLVRALLARGDQVVVLDNLHRGSFEREGLAGAALVAGDMRSAADCAAAAAGCEVVIHLAAQSNVMGSESAPDYTFETNVTGTWNIARAAAAAGVRRFVFASSREVYGEPRCVPVVEEAPMRPKNVYGASKVAGEALLAGGAAGAASVVTLRLANVIGPGDNGRVLPNWLDAVRRGDPMRVYGGAQELDFLPVDTCVAALVAAVDCDAPDGPVNVGSGCGTALLVLAERLRQLYGDSSRIEMLPARSAEVVRFVADVTRMREILGIEPSSDPLATLPGPGDAPW